MTEDINILLANYNKRPGASDHLIANSEDQLQLKLPNDYVQLLKLTNGGEGFIGKASYVIFWEVEELASLNESYEVHEYARGFLIFGSNGGGEAYGFDTRIPEWPVVQIPFVGMDWSLAEMQGKTFNDFLKTLFEVQ